MPAAVVPLIATGISAGVGAYGAKKQANAQKQMLQSQQPLINAQTAMAQQTMQQGQQLFNFGMPRLAQGSQYYSQLLNGGRAGIAAAMAPEIGAVTDIYRGAERGLERSGVRGAARDTARAELAREQAGRISGMALNARPGAAAALTGIGQQAIGASGALTGQAGNLYDALLQGNRAQQGINLDQRKYGDAQSAELWKNIGKLFVGGYGAWQNRGGGPDKWNTGGYSA